MLCAFKRVLVNFIRNTVSEDEFIRLGIWCFSFHLEYKPRHTSEKICSEKGGQLIMLDSDKKIAVVRKYIKARGFTSDLNLQKRQFVVCTRIIEWQNQAKLLTSQTKS